MKAKISAKILIALCCITLVMPFSFNQVHAYDSDIYVSLSQSQITYIDDTEDSRYQIARKYISINFSQSCVGNIHITLATDNNYFSGAVSSPYMYSFDGVDCVYQGVSSNISTPEVYGWDFELRFQNQSQTLLVFEYKVLKSVNTGTHGPIEFNAKWNNNVTNTMYPTAESLISGDIELLILNENLSDQAIESYLQQINQNYLPTIIDVLQDIHGALEVNGEGAYQSYVYVKNTERLNMTNSNTGSFYYPQYYIENYYGDGFSITNDGKIKCNYDGYVIIANNAYYYRYTNFASREIDVYWTWRKNQVDVTGASKYEYTFPAGYSGGYTGGTTDIVAVQKNDILDFVTLIRTSNPLSYMESSSALIYYMSKDNNLDYTQVLSDQLRYQMLIYDTLLDIKDMIPNEVQQETIINIDNELNVYNEQVTTITNTYNTDFTDLQEQLEFPDLLDVDPESQTNILDSVNLYNTTFSSIIDVPYMKSILIFLLLCILIVGLVG